jgi:hypothetical protein
MQEVVPITDHNPLDYEHDEIMVALRAATRTWEFRYDLLDSGNQKIDDLRNVRKGSIEQNWLADIKRTAKFTITDDGAIDYLSNRIRPWVRLHMPQGSYVEWPQGVFLLASPVRGADEQSVITREVQGYDPLLVFKDDKAIDRYTVASGTAYTTAVSTLLGSIPKNVSPSALTLPTAKEWAPGTSFLVIINELLNAVNYESLSFDENGTAIVKPYSSPQDRPEEYVYADDDKSLIIPDPEQELDLFDVPNRWLLVVSDPDRAALSSLYTNTDPSSPTSTVRRQRTITDFRTEEDAADQTTLDAKAARLAFEASQIYEAIDFTTGLLPLHSGNDVYRIMYGPLVINAKYSEHTWGFELSERSVMKHRARRVVTV